MAATATLPPELWLRILQNLQAEEDLSVLWTSHRHVCQAFRDAVEIIMLEGHLQKTWVLFRLGELEGTHVENSSGLFDVGFTFSDLSEDKTKAIFKAVDVDEEYKKQILVLLHEAVDERTIEHPAYDVSIRREINDIPVPGLTVDYETMQITFDWREVFSIFFGEEQIYHSHLTRWTKNQEQWTIGLREKMERGELDMEKMLDQVIGGFAIASEDARKQARRARMRREYQRFRNIEWVPESEMDETLEKDSLKRLQDARTLLEFSGDSDEEDEEEDSEDEWENESDANSHTTDE